jgi:hypothetical protein
MSSPARLRLGWMASAFALASGISMLLLTRVDTIEFAPQRWLYLIAGWLLVASAIGPIVEVLDTLGRILLWNGIGWSAGLALFGLESVGSMPLWPLMLAALALTFWPKSPGRALPPAAIMIALGGGFAICWLGWRDISLPIPSDWLEVD